ncbi:hypothetical protein [Thiohalophilus sp.]|uniref:hypothetical protein n=1 Tax=Thiohalophilus sp. TaxID=3028392 RepID=UPI0039750327
MVKRSILALLAPPVAVCRYGCAGCCAAPIAVFWIAGISSIVYAFFGGPLATEGISLGTLALGAALWGIASIWAETVIKSVEQDENDPECEVRGSTVCRMVRPRVDEHDPMEDVKKFHSR